jgi:hypothetical protein
MEYNVNVKSACIGPYQPNAIRQRTRRAIFYFQFIFNFRQRIKILQDMQTK